MRMLVTVAVLWSPEIALGNGFPRRRETQSKEQREKLESEEDLRRLLRTADPRTACFAPQQIMYRRHHKSTILSSSLSSCQCRATILAPIFLITIALTLTLYITLTKPTIFSPIPSSKLKWNTFQNSVLSRPTVEFTNGTVVISQIPDSPKAVLFLAHGCNGRAANFWDRCPACPNCVGLPEERLITLHALHRKFAVLSISSYGKCWSFSKEKETVKWIIKCWTEKNKLEKLPLTAMGASSGGYFVSALAAEMRFSSIVIMIAEGVFEEMGVPEGYPPTMFLHMPKDRRRMRLIRMNMEAMSKKGVDVKEVRCVEFALTPELLSDRILGLSCQVSLRLFALFLEEGFIDENGYMRRDGRRTPWMEAMKRRGLLTGKFELGDHVEEELNLAFGYHEMTSLQSDDMLSWFETHMV